MTSSRPTIPAAPSTPPQLKEMATRVAALQDKDGLWHAGLLDPEYYALPEISGSAFFTYAIAWGINHHLLDRQTFEPVVTKAWRGMLTHIYADGRLGCIQQTGAEPAFYYPTSKLRLRRRRLPPRRLRAQKNLHPLTPTTPALQISSS